MEFKTYVNWYTFAEFNSLIQAMCVKDPKRTLKDFIKTFGGVKKNKLKISAKYLSEIANTEDAIADLYNQLKTTSKAPSPKNLKTYLTSKEHLVKVYSEGDTENLLSKTIFGTFDNQGANIPYAIQGYSFYVQEDRESQILTSVNMSITYKDMPLYFEDMEEIRFCGNGQVDLYRVDSISDLLESAGVQKVKSLVIYLNLICPSLQFTDKAKTEILCDPFHHDLIKVLEYICKGWVKQVKKANKQERKTNREDRWTGKKQSKIELMKSLFMEGYKIASTDEKYPTMARQVFYKVREIANLRHGVQLDSDKDYGPFTQQVVTYFFEKYPYLEKRILLGRRGYFESPFLHTKTEIPLGTADVERYISEKYSNKISTVKKIVYDLAPELQHNHVLFVEKEGFFEIFKRSGLTQKMNLGLMTTQGFGTRACKNLIKFFLDKGMKVYILHDCDIAGCLIAKKFKEGSNTFKEKLDVIDIGLSVADIKKMGKDSLAETVKYKKEYSLAGFTQEEREFFETGNYQKFRRVELNALTTEELLNLIESKIKYKPIKPKIKELESFIDIDKMEILKEALFDYYSEKVDGAEKDLIIDINIKEIAKEIHTKINGKGHWTDFLDSEVSAYKRDKIKEIKEKLKEIL